MNFWKYALTTTILVLSVSVNGASISGQGTWETTLQGRDLDGNSSTTEAYYDTILNITWLADVMYAQTSGYDTDGLMNWNDANIWASNLNINGINGWRLPETNPVNGITYDIRSTYDGRFDRGYNISAPGTIHEGSTGSEMAHMFFNTLGNQSYRDIYNNIQTNFGLSNSALFNNLLPNNYVSATSYSIDTDSWYFSYTYGSQSLFNKSLEGYAWAVHSGDVGVATVPLPPAFLLFGSGIIGLIGIMKRRNSYS